MLTPEQRTQIHEWAAQGVAKAEIGRRLSVSRASVYRVLTGEHGQEIPAPAKRTQGKGEARALLACLFELFEDLREVLRKCLDNAASAKFCEKIGWFNLPGEENGPGLKEWGDLYLKIEHLSQEVERQVQELSIDVPGLQRLYMDMLDVRTAWARYTDRPEAAEEPELFAWRQEELSLLDRIINSVKKLIIGHRH